MLEVSFFQQCMHAHASTHTDARREMKKEEKKSEKRNPDKLDSRTIRAAMARHHTEPESQTGHNGKISLC